MEVLALGLTALLAALLGAGASGFVLWWLIRKSVLKPQVVYDEPLKKRLIVTPGDGVLEIREKRKCKVIDEEALATDQINKKRI